MNVGAHRSVLRSLVRGLCGVLAAGGGVACQRPLRRASTVLALSVACMLSLFGGVAQAEPPKLISYGTVSAGPVLPDGVAVDPSSGDVYVASFANQSFSSSGHVDKFDASGKLLSPPSPFAEGLRSGVAVNPTNGDVYAVNPEGVSIETFAPSGGAPLSSFPIPDSGNFGGLTLVQIATDSAGNVYVPVVPNNEVLEYSPTGKLLQTFTGSGAGALKEPTGVAVAPSGDVWVADAGNNRIEELGSTGAFIGEIKSEGVGAVALDEHEGAVDVLALVKNRADFCGSLQPPCSHLVEYNTSGAQLADIGAGDFEVPVGEGIILPSTVAVNESSGRVYVTDSAKGLVWVFGPPTTPAVDSEFTAEVTTSEAKLGALVSPGGIETSYRFEYGATTAYGQTTPFPEGNVGEGIASHAVWAAASGLAPGTTYHYRVVATNELGTAVGPDQTFTTETSAQVACPNEELRSGFSARLPDCRAYELVTPPTKTSVQFDSRQGSGSQSQASSDGNRVSFTTQEPLPGAPAGGEDYVATRGAGGWTSEDMIPLYSYTAVGCNEEPSLVTAYSDDLAQAVVINGSDSRASNPSGATSACNGEGVQVVSGEPLDYENLLLRDSATGAYQLINVPPPGVTPADAHFQGASSGLSHVVFSEHAQLTPNAPAGAEDLYEWDEGAIRLLTVLPDGTPAQGSLPEPIAGTNAISAEGSHILFLSGGSLYVRIDGERTVQVDESQGGGGSSGGGSFQAASADGTEIFFTDDSQLTADSTAGPDLYECALPEGASKCVLSDLTVAQGGEHAGVIRVSPLGAKDSSHVYFVASGVLARNTREYTNSEGNVVLERAQAGQENLYMWSGGTTTFIASASGASQASPDGTWFAFDASKSLTGYDNEPAQGGLPANELFLYDAASNELACASCNPTGEQPLDSNGGAESLNLGRFSPRYISNGGRLFFEANEALLPSDTNGQTDVYEYEDGRLSLISSGTSSSRAKFLDASESGDDVFFLTRQALVPQDSEEEGRVIYDARMDGGFPAPVSPPPCTTADSCRAAGSSQPSIYGAPSSQTFSGAGNLAPSPPAPAAKLKHKALTCDRGFVRKKVKLKSRCVRKPTRKAGKSAHAKKRGH